MSENLATSDQLTAEIAAPMMYLDASETNPSYLISAPEAGDKYNSPQLDRRIVDIYDMRDEMSDLSLDKQGFEIVNQQSAVTNFFDDEEVRNLYYDEIENLVKTHLGASKVVVFDHNVRNADQGAAEGVNVRRPVRFVHNDYTETSGPQRVRDLVGGQFAEELLKYPFSVVNVWRPIQWKAQDKPLGVCDAQSMVSDDFVETDLVYTDRVGKIFSIKHNPNHRWYYVSDMDPNEVMLLKCYDSERDGRARFTAHSSFNNPSCPADAKPRTSIEIRTLVFYAPAEVVNSSTA